MFRCPVGTLWGSGGLGGGGGRERSSERVGLRERGWGGRPEASSLEAKGPDSKSCGPGPVLGARICFAGIHVVRINRSPSSSAASS